MEELSLEQKAQRYDEAIEKAKRYYNEGKTLEYANDIVSDIFPELKQENKDEKIRKELINYFKENNAALAFKGISNENVLSWLEKKGEQKPADKVEPKFHEGDWIVHHGTENIYQVVAVINNQYQLKYSDNYTIQNCADVDRCARLFKFSNYIKPVKV